MLAELANDPDIQFVHPDRAVQATAYSGNLDYGWMTVTGLSSPNAALPYDAGNSVTVTDPAGKWKQYYMDLQIRDDFGDAIEHRTSRPCRSGLSKSEDQWN